MEKEVGEIRMETNDTLKFERNPLWEELMCYYSCAIMEVETKFKVLDRQFSLEHERNPIVDIQSRLKSPESLLDKLERRGYERSLNSIEENIFDVAGVRIVTSFIDDVYMLGDCLVKQDDVKLLRRKDYIENPKENGYRSLHLIIETPIFLRNGKKMMKVEVQLRTIAMEFWANLDHKLRYKKDMEPNLLKMTTAELTECAALSAQLDNRMQSIRNVIDNI